MADLNRVTLIGRLGRDPEIRSVSSGDRVCNLSVACSESWKPKDGGDRKETTEWYRISVWSQPLVDLLEKYTKKGSRLFIEGKGETRKWTDASGAEKYTFEVVLRQFGSQIILLDGKRADEGGGQSAAPSSTRAALDDEIPF